MPLALKERHLPTSLSLYFYKNWESKRLSENIEKVIRRMKEIKNLDYWRNYFEGVNSTIFEIIYNAIIVAPTDHPKEFRLQRGQIAEKLYWCHWNQCCGHDDHNEECASDLKIGGGNRQNTVNSSRDAHAEMNTGKFSYSEAEALTDEIDEENQIFGEVIRIKEILDHFQDESETGLFESLRRLQLMVPSVEILQATKIGKAVNALRGHRSNQISQFAGTLVDGWKIMVTEWIDAAAAIVDSSSHLNPSTVVEEGLPSPPLDEGAPLFATQTPIELSQFFDGIDEDENPENNMEYHEEHHESRRHPLPENQQNSKQKSQLPKHFLQESVDKSTKPSNYESPCKKNIIRKSQSSSQQDTCKLFDDAAVEAKLEATTRKLQQGYQQAENARKQRTTKFMDFKELPKQKLGPRNPYLKRKNYFRYLTHGRH
ncbi:probable mediator of RNA polymerase II transcription subunit 26b [Corylus avellana]|uniref:probable mediator of RNA polymerase II transcription subunit 26b n=1 Tax=Corylus avellana TaxID=13451 RepID=UPI00286B7040|nr:probable mediator of RNA polymerase II transcription subunit 26b [Corylus avellana]